MRQVKVVALPAASINQADRDRNNKAYGFVVFVVMDLAGAWLFSHQFIELRFRHSRGFIECYKVPECRYL